MGRIGKQLFWIYVLTFIGSIFSYLIRILYSRKLTVQEYGLFYAVFSFVFFFWPIRDLGLTQATIYYINKYFATGKTKLIKTIILIGLVPQFVLGLIISAGLFLMRNFLVTYYFKDANAAPLMTVLLIYFAVHTFLPTIFNLFAISKNYILMQLFSPLEKILIFIFSLIFFQIGYGYLTPALAYTGSFVILFFIFGYIFLKKFDSFFKEKFHFDKKLIKKIFLYGLPLLFSMTANHLLAYSDVLILTKLTSIKDVGYYNIAIPCMNLILIFIYPIQSLLFPIISREWHQKHKKNITNLLNFLYNNVLFFVLPLALIFITFPEAVIGYLFDPKYLPNSIAPLRVLAGFFIFQVVRMIGFSTVAGLGMPKEQSKIILVGGVINIALDLILIPYFHLAGAAIATGVGHLTMALLTLRIIRTKIEYKIRIKEQLKIFAAGIIMLLSMILLKQKLIMAEIPKIIVIIGCAGLIYLATLFILKFLTKDKLIEGKKLLDL